jgi:hypothetical protein
MKPTSSVQPNAAVVDKLAAEVYDFCCTNRADNKSGNPREVGNDFDSLYEQPKNFYRNVARWYLMRTSRWQVDKDLSKLPLGKVTNDSAQFEKSLEDPNARVYPSYTDLGM